MKLNRSVCVWCECAFFFSNKKNIFSLQKAGILHESSIVGIIISVFFVIYGVWQKFSVYDNFVCVCVLSDKAHIKIITVKVFISFTDLDIVVILANNPH